MRYFLISFSHSTGDGNLTLVNETFPNYQGILATLKEQDAELENITILNIIELSEQDYKDFTE
jgi:hypothetical protein